MNPGRVRESRVEERHTRNGQGRLGQGRRPATGPGAEQDRLLELQRLIGNRAVCSQLHRSVPSGQIGEGSGTSTSGLRAQPGHGADVIWRKVGFEFETSMKTARYVPKTKNKALQTAVDNNDFQKRDYLHQTEDAPLMGEDETLQAMNKKEPVVNTRADAFTAEADEEITSGNSYLEYVTKPFDDTKSGAMEASKAVSKIVAMETKILAAAEKKKGSVAMKSSEFSSFGKPQPGTMIVGSRSNDGTVQASVGVRLDKVATLMTQMGGKQPGETEEQTTALSTGRAIVGAGLGSPENADDTNADITGAAPRFADRAITEYLEEGDHPEWVPFGDSDEAKARRDALQSFVALLVQYILKAPSVINYAKTMAPLLARTDFATMFSHLDKADQTYLGAHNGLELRLLVKAACDYRGADLDLGRAVVPSVYTDGRIANDVARHNIQNNMLAGLTIRKWLTGIANGKDYLTEKLFREAVPTAGEGAEHHLESLGHLGDQPNPVGREGLEGAVFEIRTLGKLHYGAWYKHAMELVNYVYDLNNGDPATFKESFNLDKMRVEDRKGYDAVLSGDPKKMTPVFKKMRKTAEKTIKERFT